LVASSYTANCARAKRLRRRRSGAQLSRIEYPYKIRDDKEEPVPLPPDLAAINGAQSLYDWFGYWPSFHDAEILHLHLNRSGSSQMAIHTWHTTPKTDEKGYYIVEKHVVVDFTLQGISDLELIHFSPQNVISGLEIKKKDDGFMLKLGPCYGLAGTIEALKVSIGLHAGEPAPS
jgi:hypothetical protein